MLNVFNGLSRDRRKAGELYGRVVAAARQPALYREMGVPDTAEGRFEMVALMLFLGLERLQHSGPNAERLQQLTIEHFVTDMDDCLREMGVGDLTVPKKVRRAAGAFYERAAAYRKALESGDGEIELALRTYAYGTCPQDLRVPLLAPYVRSVRSGLQSVSETSALHGELSFASVTLAREGGRHDVRT